MLNYIPENVKLTDFRYRSKEIKRKLLEEKKALLLVDRASQIALLVPIGLLRAGPVVQSNERVRKLSWPAYHLGKIKISLNRKNIYEAF